MLEKAGRRSEIELVHRELKPFGIMQFTRSGRIAVTKTEMPISTLLQRIKKSNEVAFIKDQA